MVKWKGSYDAFYKYAAAINSDLPGCPNLLAVREAAESFACHFGCAMEKMEVVTIVFSCDEETLTAIKLTCPEAVEKVYG